MDKDSDITASLICWEKGKYETREHLKTLIHSHYYSSCKQHIHDKRENSSENGNDVLNTILLLYLALLEIIRIKENCNRKQSIYLPQYLSLVKLLTLNGGQFLMVRFLLFQTRRRIKLLNQAEKFNNNVTRRIL